MKIGKRIVFLKILSIIFVLTWMITVFYFSSEVAIDSSETSSRFILPIVKFFRPDLEGEMLTETVSSLQFIVRKLAHFTLYTLGGIIICNMYKSFDVYDKWKLRLYSFITGYMYAATDEVHQFFVEGRSCEIRDVLIDSLGIIIGICIFELFRCVLKKKKQEEKK